MKLRRLRKKISVDISKEEKYEGKKGVKWVKEKEKEMTRKGWYTWEVSIKREIEKKNKDEKK